MAGCSDRTWRVGSKVGGTRSQFRLNTQGLLPFKCTYPVYLTDVMEVGQSSQSCLLRGSEMVSPNKGTRTLTIREYEKTITELKKENLELKLNLYLLEESVNKNLCKDGSSQNKDHSVEVIVELRLETESLRKELSYKNKILEDALDQAQKYASDLAELQKEYSQLQQQLTSAEERPSKEKLTVLEDVNTLLQKDIENLEASLSEKKQELEEVVGQIEELSVKNKHLEEKVKKSSLAIQGFVYKHSKEVQRFPKEIRPIIQSAVQAAKDNDHKSLVAAMKSFKAALCDMMTIPIKFSEYDSEEKVNKDANSLAKCLKEEVYNSGEKFKRIERHQSDPSVQLHHLQNFKESAIEYHVETEQLSKSLELVEQDFTRIERILTKSSMSAAGNVLKTQENPVPLNLISHENESVNITKTTLNLSEHHSSESFNSSEINQVYASTLESVIRKTDHTKNSDENSDLKDILKENEELKNDVAEKANIIQELNSTCSELESRQIQMQRELNEALSKAKKLEIKTSNENEKFKSSVSKSASKQNSAIKEQLLQFKSKGKSFTDAANSNNVDELKEEIYMLLLTIEEKDEDLSKVKKTLESLEVDLENALNKRELESNVDIHERNELRERLALSCSVNNELMQHLQSLEAFMEDLLLQRNLDSSSLENISSTSDFLSQLSKRLDESVKLSQVLSDQLSICEGSKVFGPEASLSREDISFSEGKSYQHLGLSKLNISTLDGQSKTDEGRNDFIPNTQKSFKNTAGTGKRWSYSSRHKSSLLPDSDSIVVLGTSNNEDLILLLNENGDPADVLIRNSVVNTDKNVPENSFSLQMGGQHSRPCWESNSIRGFTWNAVNNHQNLNLNGTQMKTVRQGHAWNGHGMSSDSDIWSEPDRDVSMQRIGIDVKSSPVTQKSPRKLRFKDKRTTDELSSENISTFGAYKVQSWSRRRRSSGSASKRLFSKETSGRKDYRLEKHYSLLSEKLYKFTKVLDQIKLEKMKVAKTDKSGIVEDMFDELNGVLSSVKETLHKLSDIKENTKSFTPIICEKCCIAELLIDLEKTRKRLHASDLLEASTTQIFKETNVEPLTQTFLSEVDDLKRQLEEPHAILSSGIEYSEDESEKLNQLNKLLTNEKNKNSELQILLKETNAKNELLGKEIEDMKEKNKLLRMDHQDNFVGEQSEKAEDKTELDPKENDKDFIEKQNLELKKNNELIAAQLAENKLKNKTLEKEFKIVVENIKLLENQLEEAQTKNAFYKKEMKNQHEQESSKNETIELKEKNLLIAKQLEKVEELNKILERQFEEAQNKCTSIEYEKKKLQSEKEALADQFKCKNELLEKELKEIQRKNAILEKDLNEMKSILENEKALAANLKEENGKLSKVVDDLKKELLDMESEKNKLSEENSENTQKLDEFKKKNNQLIDLVHEHEKNTSETNRICNQLRSDLESTKEKLITLDSQCSEYEMQLSLESKSKANCLAQIKTSEKNALEQKESFLKTLSDVNAQKDQMLEELSREKEQFVSLEKERNDLANLLEDKKQEIVFLKKSNSELEKEKSALLKEKEIKELELLSANSMCDNLRTELKAMGDCLHAWESKCANYESQIALASSVKNSFVQKLETIERELTSNNTIVNNFCNMHLTENNAVEDKAEIVFDKPSTLDKDKYIENLCENIISKNSEFSKRVGYLMQQIKDSSIALAESKSMAENYNFKLMSLKKQVEQQQNEIYHINKQNDSLKKVIDEHLKTISEKERIISLKDFEIHSLQMQLTEAHKEVSQDQQKLKEFSFLEAEKEQLKKDNDYLQTIINEYLTNVNEKVKLLNKNESEISTLKQQVINLQTEILKTNSQINSKDDEITNLQERIFNLQTQVNNLLSEKIGNEKQKVSSLRNGHSKDAETSVSGSNIVNKEAQTAVMDFHKSLNLSADSSKSDLDPDESQSLSPRNSGNGIEKLKKKIEALQTKLSMSAKRVEILEQEKNDLRENLRLQMHSRRKSLVPEDNNLKEKVLELESKLEKKASFIKELKSELYRTCNSLVEKQKEVDDLHQKLSHLDISTKCEAQYEREHLSHSNIFSPDDEANIHSLRKYKWELILAIFGIQKKFYEEKGIHVNHFEKFTKHIESLYSLQLSTKLSKSESEPILSSGMEYQDPSISSKSQITLKALLIGLELDVECLQNLKIFLKRFFNPFVLHETQVSYTKPDADDSNLAVIERHLANHNAHKIHHQEASMTKQNNSFNVTIESIVTVRQDDGLLNTENRFERIASTVSQKVDAIENLIRTLDSELLNAKDLEFTLEEKSISVPTARLLSKISSETKSFVERTKIFHLNAALKSSDTFKSTVPKSCSKQDMSDRESVLSEETITLSRSQSLSPVSFEEGLPAKITPSNSVELKIDHNSLNQSQLLLKTEDTAQSYSTKLQTALSSQDSVCHRSHYSSPDLGIESDPNHDSSAPEQMEKDVKASINYETEIRIRPKSIGRQHQKSMFTSTSNDEKLIDPEVPLFLRGGGETLRAIGILQEYELLKREVQESLVGIKSVLSRTGDGLHHIAKYTSPRKNLEYSTFRAIKDTCANIEVCLKEAYKLVNNFWIAPCPSVQEWNALIQQNQEQYEKLLVLKNCKIEHENDFREAMEKLQRAELQKENMERKISKKLVKTKKVLRLAELKLLENQCQTHQPVANDPSVCQENL